MGLTERRGREWAEMKEFKIQTCRGGGRNWISVFRGVCRREKEGSRSAGDDEVPWIVDPVELRIVPRDVARHGSRLPRLPPVTIITCQGREVFVVTL